jgi:hypothetical protein
MYIGTIFYVCMYVYVCVNARQAMTIGMWALLLFSALMMLAGLQDFLTFHLFPNTENAHSLPRMTDRGGDFNERKNLFLPMTCPQSHFLAN